MRHRCWGSGFPEDRLGSFREARVALSAGVACWRGLGTVQCTKVGIYCQPTRPTAGDGDCVLHEGRDLLGEGWVYWMGVGGSCSVDNPWPVDPDLRGVGTVAVLRSPFAG